MALTEITALSANNFCALVVGRPGIGKTSLLRTIPPEERCLTISAESGLLCVNDLVKAGQVEGYEIENVNDFLSLLGYCKSDEWKATYKWIFIDSLTEIADLCAKEWKERYPDKKDSFNLWGGYTDMMTLAIKGFRDLKGYNVIFSCLPTVEKDEIGRRFLAPSMPGKLKERLISFFDEVFLMDLINDEDGGSRRAFFTQPLDNFEAKDRSGNLDFIEQPDLGLIKQKILGE